MAGNGEEGNRIDVGLALLSVARKPGRRLTRDDIAAWSGCHRETIRQIELRAVKKLRRRLREIDIDRAEDLPMMSGGGTGLYD